MSEPKSWARTRPLFHVRGLQRARELPCSASRGGRRLIRVKLLGPGKVSTQGKKRGENMFS